MEGQSFEAKQKLTEGEEIQDIGFLPGVPSPVVWIQVLKDSGHFRWLKEITLKR